MSKYYLRYEDWSTSELFKRPEQAIANTNPLCAKLYNSGPSLHKSYFGRKMCKSVCKINHIEKSATCFDCGIKLIKGKHYAR